MPLTVAGKLLYMAVTSAISFAAAFFLKIKQPKTPLDDNRTEPSERGTLLGLLTGHYRIGPVIGFVGGRFTVDEKVEGGGGKGGGSDPTQTVYYERGWHLLNVGEARSLRRIYQSGKAIWQGEITPTSHPSGTSVDLGSEGRFFIYWGEDDQPVNTSLASYIGVGSRWPHTCYIWWDWKRLGGQAVWPQIEYELTVAPKSQGVVVADTYLDYQDAGYSSVAFEVYTQVFVNKNVYRSNTWDQLRVVGETTLANLEEGMDINIEVLGAVVFRAEVTEVVASGGYTYVSFNAPLPIDAFDNTVMSSGWYTSSLTINSDAFSDQGANAAVSIEQFLFAPRPFGAGLPASAFDSTLQDISDLLISEEIPCTTLLRSGRSWKDGVASIMQDIGILMFYDMTAGKYSFKALRDTDTTTEISSDHIKDDSVSETFAYAVLAADTQVFTFKDSARNFATSTLPDFNDAEARYGADPNVKAVALETITSYKPAAKTAQRRSSESSSSSSMGLETSYLVRKNVGDAVTLEGSDIIYRILSIESNTEEANRTYGLLRDSYITGADFIVKTPQGLNPQNRASVSPDAAVGIVEANRFLIPDTHGYHVLRIRHDQLPTGAFIYNSSNDISYTLNGDTPSVTGGVLTEAVTVDDGAIIDQGPEFDLLGSDIDKVLDLSAQEEDWRSGTQMCLIGNELFFLQNITAISGTTYRLDGLIRARLGTPVEAHAIDDVVFIFLSSALGVFNEPWLLAGQDLYVKALPYNNSSTVAIESVPAQSLSYSGGGYRPLPPENLNTTNDAQAYESGQSAYLKWDYKSVASGAGQQLSDEPSSISLPEGYFRVTILNGTTAVRTEDVLVPSFEYTQVMMITDFGAEPSTFNVEVVEVLNGLTSTEDTATIVKV